MRSRLPLSPPLSSLDPKPGVRVLKSGEMQAGDELYRVASLQRCIAGRAALGDSPGSGMSFTLAMKSLP